MVLTDPRRLASPADFLHGTFAAKLLRSAIGAWLASIFSAWAERRTLPPRELRRDRESPSCLAERAAEPRTCPHAAKSASRR